MGNYGILWMCSHLILRIKNEKGGRVSINCRYGMEVMKQGSTAIIAIDRKKVSEKDIQLVIDTVNRIARQNNMTVRCSHIDAKDALIKYGSSWDILPAIQELIIHLQELTIRLQKFRHHSEMTEYLDNETLSSINFDFADAKSSNKPETESTSTQEDIDYIAAISGCGIPQKDIELVVSQVNCDYRAAKDALIKHKGNIVDAIMELTS